MEEEKRIMRDMAIENIKFADEILQKFKDSWKMAKMSIEDSNVELNKETKELVERIDKEIRKMERKTKEKKKEVIKLLEKELDIERKYWRKA